MRRREVFGGPFRFAQRNRKNQMSSVRSPSSHADPFPDFVPVRQARAELAPASGAPIALQTVYTLGVRGEIDVRHIGGRFVVTRTSIDAYRARRGLK
jgi:hypothetical protein